MKNQKNEMSLLAQFENLKGCKFIAIRQYNSKTTGEIANHILLANFSYGNAVKKDLTALQGATGNDALNIAKEGNFDIELVNKAIEKLTNSFINNQNKETQSNQSKGQQDTYVNITNSIKIHKETLKVHIFALHVSKEILVRGEYKTVNSRELTLCQNAVKKYFAFSTAKYRNFIIDSEYLTGNVSISGEKYMIQ